MDSVKYLLIFSFVVFRVNCIIQFQHDTEQCLDQLVEYQCTVTGTGFTSLTWRILEDDGTPFGNAVTYSSNANGASNTIGGVFTVEQLQPASPVVSNISFTVQSSINGYTIECEDSTNALNNESFTINIPGIPDSPSNVIIHTDTFTSSSVDISWTESSSPCVTEYRYTVSSTTINSTTTSNSAVLEGLVPSDDPYCVTVAAVDTADRTNSSDPVCFIFNVPPAVDMFNVTNGTQSDTTIEVVVEWEEVEFDVFDDDTVVPPLNGYRVTITNTTTLVSPLQPPGTTEYTFTGVPTGRTYTVTVIAVNDVGESMPSDIEFDAPGPFVEPTSSSTAVFVVSSTAMSMVSSMTMTSSSSSASSSSSTATTSISTAPTESPSSMKSSSFQVGAVVGGIIGGIIGALLVIVAIVIIVYCCYLKKRRKSVDFLDGKEDGVDAGAASLQLKEQSKPEIGQALYQEIGDQNKPPPKEKHETPKSNPSPFAPAEGVAEVPTYQDPSTIKREQAPTGDIYTLPEKKSPAVPKPIETVPGGLYAELDIHTKPSDKSVIQSTTEPVIYADVRQ